MHIPATKTTKTSLLTTLLAILNMHHGMTSACKVYVGLEWASTADKDIADIPYVWGWSYTSLDGVCGNGSLGLAYDEQPSGRSKMQKATWYPFKCGSGDFGKISLYNGGSLNRPTTCDGVENLEGLCMSSWKGRCDRYYLYDPYTNTVCESSGYKGYEGFCKPYSCGNCVSVSSSEIAEDEDTLTANDINDTMESWGEPHLEYTYDNTSSLLDNEHDESEIGQDENNSDSNP